MSPGEEAEIWRRAARVVGAMDGQTTMLQQAQAAQPGGQLSHFSSEEYASSAAYSRAATVLNKIAAEFEAAAKSSG